MIFLYLLITNGRIAIFRILQYSSVTTSLQFLDVRDKGICESYSDRLAPNQLKMNGMARFIIQNRDIVQTPGKIYKIHSPN